MTYDENTPIWCMCFEDDTNGPTWFATADLAIDSFYLTYCLTPIDRLRVEHKGSVVLFYEDDHLMAQANVTTVGHVIHSRPTHL